VSPGSYTFQLQIPVEITVKIGALMFPGGALVASVGALTSSENKLESALRATCEALAGDPDVIEIRLGYRFKRGWITDERVVVVELRKKLSVTELNSMGKTPIPSQFFGVGVDVRTAALPDQLEHMGVDLSEFEEKARPGAYREPLNLSLTLVKEQMKAIFHVSPDSGFPNLKAFLARVERHLTATIYEWDAPHISKAIAAAMHAQGNSLKMVTQKQGTTEAVADMKHRIGSKFKHIFASVGSGKLIPSAYHIKVASRDGKEFWLSSGNWKGSNQADINPAGEHSTAITPLRQHNREWHAIIANAKLAKMFQKYIEFDFDEAHRVPLEEGLKVLLPEVFVPEAAFMEDVEKAAAVHYFEPLVLNKQLEIQPLLTPDRDSHHNRIFMANAIAMIKKGTQKIYVENQSFNLTADNNDEFENFFGVLRDKQHAGVDVRVIFRDGREFGTGNATSQQKLLERIKDFGLDTDFIRVQKKCHTKGIIVDSTEVMLGSHNLTNEGSLFNRDASLLVRDAEVATYFEKVFLFDWDVLAEQEADELVGGMRIASPGEETPLGFRRVSVAELLGPS
jgi:PLD-like domain